MTLTSSHWNHHECREGAVFTSITSLHAWSRFFFCRWTHSGCIFGIFLTAISHPVSVSSAADLIYFSQLLLFEVFFFWTEGWDVGCCSDDDVCLAGGVLLPYGVPGSHCGGGDAHQTGSGQGRAGEVSAVQRHLHRPQEGKGGHEDVFFFAVRKTILSYYSLTYSIWLLLICAPFPALLFMSKQEVFSFHLVVHLPVLQKVRSTAQLQGEF